MPNTQERREKVKKALKLKEQGGLVVDIAHKLGVSPATTRRWLRDPKYYMEHHPHGGSEADIPRDVKNAIQYYKKLLDKYEKEDDRTTLILRNMKESLSTIKPTKPFVYSGRLEGDEEIPVFLIGDEQIGQKAVKSETGFYDYNLKIFEKELRYLFEKQMKIVSLHRSSTPIKRAWVIFLGDNVENEVTFAGQPFEIDVDVVGQFFFGIELISRYLVDLTKHFEIVDTIWIAGNHGRVGRIGEHKWYVNWDYLFAKFVEQKLCQFPQITFNIPKQWWQIIDIMGWKFLIVHGEDIRRYMKLPWYDTTRFDADWSKMLQSIGKTFTYLVFGHHHVPIMWDSPYGERICNGTFVGYNTYALKRLRASVRPTQTMFMVHRKVGIASRYLVRLDQAMRR